MVRRRGRGDAQEPYEVQRIDEPSRALLPAFTAVASGRASRRRRREGRRLLPRGVADTTSESSEVEIRTLQCKRCPIRFCVVVSRLICKFATFVRTIHTYTVHSTIFSFAPLVAFPFPALALAVVPVPRLLQYALVFVVFLFW
jgi:hypothetical protein